MGDKPLSEAQKKAMAKYDANNTRRYGLKLNKKTDADIIDKFEQEKANDCNGGIQGYVKRLVRDDIKAHS